ncbi:MAG: methionyl-tRNA formyltransferase [Verrucomicrobia bacterium]|nr:methionyl-tRNA formyltransferase [Verrucomicrobiota bacterium]
MRIVFFGTPEFAATILHKLIEANINIVAIVTKPDKPKGRSLKLQSPPVKELAEKLLPGVPIFQPERGSSPESIEVLKALQADLFVVVAYGEIISQDLLDVPKRGCINVHPSLLPLYRGAAPIQRALMNGDATTGVSIIRMVRQMDAGDILHVEELAVPEDADFGWLDAEARQLGAKALLRAISDIAEGRQVATVQDPDKVTFANKITQEECHIDWNRPAHELFNLIRALSPAPGAWCEITVRGEKKRLKVLKAAMYPTSLPDTIFPGMVLEEQGSFCVSCGSGILRLLLVQPEGKAPMSAQDFLTGYKPFSFA